MIERRFFDTNILLYLYDQRDAAKRMRAVEIFRECVNAGTLVISTQVIQEFYAAATRKLNLDPLKARELVSGLCRLRIVSIHCTHILRATDIQSRFQISFWDALILATAAAAGARVLYTEDLQHGQAYDEVEARNPFRN